MTVPAEWAGTWTTVDSVYDCRTNALVKVVEVTDTLCAGEDLPRDPYVPSYASVPPSSCPGSADATHIHVHCEGGGGLCGEACFITAIFDLDATRSGDSAYWAWLTQWVSSCHSSLCDLCVLTHRHATRVAPGPCAPVPTQPESWGNLKARYH